MQVTLARFAAKGIQHKHRYVSIKFFTILGHAKIAAVHGACRCSQASATGVLKFFARLQQRLIPHHTQAFDFLVLAIGIVHAPRS